MDLNLSRENPVYMQVKADVSSSDTPELLRSMPTKEWKLCSDGNELPPLS